MQKMFRWDFHIDGTVPYCTDIKYNVNVNKNTLSKTEVLA